MPENKNIIKEQSSHHLFFTFVALNLTMKIFACILSVYILVLTAIPCIDRPEDHHLQKTEIEANANTNHHNHGGDQCSPFCTCNCCATPVIQQESIIQFNSTNLFQEFTLAEYISVFTSDYLSSIWQPPQIA